jgi:dihydrofolate synthase/folylpolyglutamate synthase
MDPRATQVLMEIANQRNATIHSAALDSERIFSTDLKGEFQAENLATAVKTLHVLNTVGWELDPVNIDSGLLHVELNTGFKGRWQLLGENPRIIADCGHNAAGVAMVMEGLKSYGVESLHMVLGVVEDKDLKSVLPLFPKEALYYFCKADIPRGLPAEELQKAALDFELKGESYSSVRRAYEAARLYAKKEDTIFIGGSFFTVAEIL